MNIAEKDKIAYEEHQQICQNMDRFTSSPWLVLTNTPRSWRRLLLNTCLLMLLCGCVIYTRGTGGNPDDSPDSLTDDSQNQQHGHDDLQSLSQRRRDALTERQRGKNGISYIQEPVKLFLCEKLSQAMAPLYPASFLHSAHPRRYPYFSNGTEHLQQQGTEHLQQQGTEHLQQQGTEHLQQQSTQADEGPDIESMSQESLLDYVLQGFTVPTHSCRKMIRIGGSYCGRKMEAEKVICFDPELRPQIGNCLVYSFGVGHELTFDKSIADYGCDVFSFDVDYNHLRYPRHIYPRVMFFKVRLGVSRLVNILTDPSGRFPYVYRPMDDIMYQLGHHRAAVSVLKIDIENSEWNVFEKSLFNTRILERTKQLSLEVHLDFLYPESQFDPHPGGIEGGLKQHARVFQGLQRRGFKLAYYEPNYNVPVNTSLFGRSFHVYFETIWVNTSPWRGRVTEPTPDLASFDTLPPVEIIHNKEQ